MTTLADHLLVDHQRDALIADCVALVEREIDRRGPGRRLTLKAGVALLNSARPGGLRWAVSRMLPEFVTALDPLYQRFRQTDDPDFSDFLRRHSAEAVDAVMAVADRRAERAKSRTLRKGYARMRGTARAELSDALPALSSLIAAYLA